VRKRGVLWDLGDTIMIEESEVKDAEGVTLAAQLLPGVAELLHELRARGCKLALVADTRAGTYRNVLRQHGLYELFDHFSISDLTGVCKPDPSMFQSALDALRIAATDAMMVGNNYAADIDGALKVGLDALWFRWNERYKAPERHQATWVCTSVAQVREVIRARCFDDVE